MEIDTESRSLHIDKQVVTSFLMCSRSAAPPGGDMAAESCLCPAWRWDCAGEAESGGGTVVGDGGNMAVGDTVVVGCDCWGHCSVGGHWDVGGLHCGGAL